MTIADIQVWISFNPELALLGAVVVALVSFLIARLVIARALVYIANRTETNYDDIIVESLRPFRVAWLAPLLIFFSFAYVFPRAQTFIEQVSLFFILWVVVITLNSLLNAVNQIYESSKDYTGVPIQGYLDLVKILFLLIGIILSISIFTGESPIVYLTGLGALTAVLLLIFRDTILSLVASVQISTNDLFREGDWIEIPSIGVDGDVVNMSLHSVKIQNFDKTFSVLPPYKLLETPFKNWRGMQEAGGRRIKRSIYLDITSVRFLEDQEVEDFKKVAVLKEYMERKQSEIRQHNQERGVDTSMKVNGRRLTNVGTFRAYIEAYLRNHPHIHTEGMTLLIRQLKPGEHGLPLELYVFTKTTVWGEYEAIQADIFDHLLAAAPEFDLRVFQNPTGADFGALGGE
ncbi:MAG: mechanosensitive ion channel family protein [Chloroflexi bacterium]|nr:MAG: mechanosensitive ion channel family protein [Chloroflexota bacterium]MBL1193999.1 mechanosensitive ion channel family protein [Chloroflexota bacterium]NOH11293.1 mechanosensitive ion channel [Chloroflexota bacterium]